MPVLPNQANPDSVTTPGFFVVVTKPSNKDAAIKTREKMGYTNQCTCIQRVGSGISATPASKFI